MTDTFASIDHDWVDAGQEISSPEQMFEYLSQIRAMVHNMHTGLHRAAYGALKGRSWVDDFPVDGEEIAGMLNMTVVPPGMPAKDAMHRQALDTLLSALDAVDRAALGAWLSHVNAQDPNRPA
jgi:hypothetical protein